MSIEVPARPVNWCPRLERRRRRARSALLAILISGWMLWSNFGIGLL